MGATSFTGAPLIDASATGRLETASLSTSAHWPAMTRMSRCSRTCARAAAPTRSRSVGVVDELEQRSRDRGRGRRRGSR